MSQHVPLEVLRRHFRLMQPDSPFLYTDVATLQNRLNVAPLQNPLNVAPLQNSEPIPAIVLNHCNEMPLQTKELKNVSVQAYCNPNKKIGSNRSFVIMFLCPVCLEEERIKNDGVETNYWCNTCNNVICSECLLGVFVHKHQKPTCPLCRTALTGMGETTEEVD